MTHMSDDYVRQRLWQAMDALAVSVASLQRRLASAGHTLTVLQVDDFAGDDERACFRRIMDTLTRYGAGGELWSSGQSRYRRASSTMTPRSKSPE